MWSLKVLSFFSVFNLLEETPYLPSSTLWVENNAEATYFLAYKEGKIVGRIAVIINHIEINELRKKKVRFGWLDMIDDIAVTKALLQKAYDIGKENNLEYAEGPVGFSNMEKAGILTEIRRRECYEKPTTERKRKAAAAVKRNLKKLSKERERLTRNPHRRR